ncbi:MAG: hypothetical protein N3F63_08215, partial [Thermoplasmata archaeon]|nr:hypothetical protein [Thermoplasmata archaeon]
IIDGAFGDWAGVQPHDDPAGDVAMTPATLPVNTNIDLNATKYTNDTNNVYFYAKVDGDRIMAGLTQVYRGVAGGGQGGTPQPVEELDVYDYLYINYTVVSVGKEYSIQVVGKDCSVISKKVVEKDIQAVVWTENTGLTASLTVACTGGELELGIPFADGQITTYTVTMTDWQGKDTTSVIFRINGDDTRTSYHTITVDGYMSDWATDELMATRNGKSLYITWDADNLYIGWTGTN